MRNIFIWLSFIFIIEGVRAFELPIDHPHYIPNRVGGLVSIGGGAGHREVEYESDSQVIDYQLYKFNEVRFNVLLSLWEKFAFGLTGLYDIDREYELKFGPKSSRSGDPSYQSSARGVLDPEIFFIYEFKSKKEDWNHQLYLRGNPFDIKESPRKIYRGGHDIFLEYRFSHQYQNGALYGALFSHYYGKKNFFLPGDSRSSVNEAYTEVGLKLGYLYRLNQKWSFFFDGTFGLSSDYVTTTPDVQRSADKGYLVFATLGLNYFLTDNCFFKFESWRGSRIYNSDQEELNRKIEYVIEDDFYLMSLNFSWGSLL